MGADKISVIACIAASLLVPMLGSPASAGGDLEAKNVIVARVRPDVSLVWKTNDIVNSLASHGVRGAGLYNAVLARAEKLLRAHADPNAGDKPVSIRLVYFHDAMDSRYKIETVSGIDTLGGLSAKAKDIVEKDAAWQRDLVAGRTPSGLTNTVGHAWADAVVTR